MARELRQHVVWAIPVAADGEVENVDRQNDRPVRPHPLPETEGELLVLRALGKGPRTVA
jgi:hypothetical protein